MNVNPPLSQPPAIPGTDSLDFDVADLLIVSAQSIGKEVQVVMVEGEGVVRGQVMRQVTGTWKAGLRSFTPQQFNEYMSTLQRWKTDKARLRVTSAPEHATVLWGPDTCLLMPRRDPA